MKQKIINGLKIAGLALLCCISATWVANRNDAKFSYNKVELQTEAKEEE